MCAGGGLRAVHLCDSPEHFVKLSMKFDACNGYFVVNIKS